MAARAKTPAAAAVIAAPFAGMEAATPHTTPEAGAAAPARPPRRRKGAGITRAVRFARRMRILAAVIREPGLKPGRLAGRAGVSESTLFRDLVVLRRQGYPVTFQDGYQLQESLGLDGPNPATSLAAVYEHQLDLLRQQLPAALADQVQAELEAEAPAALAAIVAAVIEGQVKRRSRRSNR
jgi:predicted DNA-binding transcriptional regulator YafY